MDEQGLTFVTWLGDYPVVYITRMEKDLVRQLRVAVEGLGVKGVTYDVEMMEITPDGNSASTTTMNDRNLVEVLMEFNVSPKDRERVLSTLIVL